eukprot:403336701
MFHSKKPMFVMYTDVDHITENIYLGNVNAANNLNQLKRLNFSYKVIEVLDSPAVNLHRYFDDAVEFIKQGNNNGKVFVHCHAGISRSSSCVIAFLMKEKGQSYQSALYQVRLKRPIVCPNVGFQKQLMDYQQQIRFESDQFAMPKSSNNQSRDKQLNQLTGGHMVIGERSHSLATTYQLQQEKLKQQKQAQEETKVDFSHIKSQSLYGQQNIGLDQARKEFLTTGNPMMINSLGVKPKTSNDLNDPRKEPMQKRQQSQFEIAGISFLQSNSNTQEIKNKNNLEVNKSQLGNIQSRQNQIPNFSSSMNNNIIPQIMKMSAHSQLLSANNSPILQATSQFSYPSTFSTTSSNTQSQVQRQVLGASNKVCCLKCKTPLFNKTDILSHVPNTNQTNLQPQQIGIGRIGQETSPQNTLLSKQKQFNQTNIRSLSISYTGTALQPYQNNSASQTTQNSTQSCCELFINKQDWIGIFGESFGSVMCPNKKECGQKLGIFSKNGLKCQCGKFINPGFMIYKDKCSNI